MIIRTNEEKIDKFKYQFYKYKGMLISEVLNKLKEIQKKEGDIDVRIYHSYNNESRDIENIDYDSCDKEVYLAIED